MFENIQNEEKKENADGNEDKVLQAFHTGDQEVGSFQSFMNGVPVLRSKNLMPENI